MTRLKKEKIKYEKYETMRLKYLLYHKTHYEKKLISMPNDNRYDELISVINTIINAKLVEKKEIKPIQNYTKYHTMSVERLLKELEVAEKNKKILLENKESIKKLLKLIDTRIDFELNAPKWIPYKDSSLQKAIKHFVENNLTMDEINELKQSVDIKFKPYINNTNNKKCSIEIYRGANNYMTKYINKKRDFIIDYFIENYLKDKSFLINTKNDCIYKVNEYWIFVTFLELTNKVQIERIEYYNV